MVLFTSFLVVFAGLASLPASTGSAPWAGLPGKIRARKTSFKLVKELFKSQNFKLYQAAVAAPIRAPLNPPAGGDSRRIPGWVWSSFQIPLFSLFPPLRGGLGWGFLHHFIFPFPSAFSYSLSFERVGERLFPFGGGGGRLHLSSGVSSASWRMKTPGRTSFIT